MLASTPTPTPADVFGCPVHAPNRALRRALARQVARHDRLSAWILVDGIGWIDLADVDHRQLREEAGD